MMLVISLIQVAGTALWSEAKRPEGFGHTKER